MNGTECREKRNGVGTQPVTDEKSNQSKSPELEQLPHAVSQEYVNERSQKTGE